MGYDRYSVNGLHERKARLFICDYLTSTGESELTSAAAPAPIEAKYLWGNIRGCIAPLLSTFVDSLAQMRTWGWESI